MKKLVLLLSVTLVLPLTGCLGTAWTGATLLYDRHDVYNNLNDYKLSATTGHLLAKDHIFDNPGCKLDIAVFHGAILLAGHVSSEALKQAAIDRLKSLSGYRVIYNQITIGNSGSDSLFDSWITTKIRTRIFADSSIAPNEFKIVTVDGIVYILGDIRKEQADSVVDIARTTDKVIRVVKLFRVLTVGA